MEVGDLATQVRQQMEESLVTFVGVTAGDGEEDFVFGGEAVAL
jgi:hypothetical protein